MKLYLDQYGNRFFANTVKDLRSQIGMGGSRVHRLYKDKQDGATVHIGYVIGGHWLTAYVGWEQRA